MNKLFTAVGLSLALLQANDCMAQQSNSPGYLKTDIRDLVLIYQGGVQRMDFTVDQLRPYVVHENRFGGRDWLFDGFLFLEFDSGRGVSFEKRLNAPMSKKEDWEWLVDRHFGDGIGIAALDECIGQEIEKIGKPSFKHKVVISIPEPAIGQTDWGEQNGRKLDFSLDEDRIEACKWYIDMLTARFDSLQSENIELSGFYWLSEKALQSRAVTKAVSEYIHSMGKLFYWIPYYTAQGFSEWRQAGFDAAYIQPTYFWNRKIHDDRVDRACELAYNHNMGLEMEFDLSASVDNADNKRDRGLKYMSSFRKNGVYRDASLAYYEGGAGMYHFTRKTSPLDREFIDTVAWFVQERRRRMAEGMCPDFVTDFCDKTLSERDWNTSGQVRTKKGCVKMYGNATINTRGMHDFKYGTVKARIRIKAKNPDAKVSVSLLPAKELLGPYPNSGEMFLMRYDGKNPSEIACGAATMQMNEKLNNIKQSIFIDPKLTDRWIELECKWTEYDVIFKIDGRTINIQEDLFDSSKPWYAQGWPFNADNFYLQISTQGGDKELIAEVDSIAILPD